MNKPVSSASDSVDFECPSPGRRSVWERFSRRSNRRRISPAMRTLFPPTPSWSIRRAKPRVSVRNEFAGRRRREMSSFRATKCQHCWASECLREFPAFARWESHSKSFETKWGEIVVLIDIAIDPHQSFLVFRWILPYLGQFRSADHADLENCLQTGSCSSLVRTRSDVLFRKATDWRTKTFGSSSLTSGNPRPWRRNRKAFLVGLDSLVVEQKETHSVCLAMIRLEFNQIHPGDSVDCCLDPQLNRLKPYTDDTRRPIKELLEFPSREIYLPHTSYRNLLYLYPLSLNLSNLTTRSSTSARNIAVKIQLMGGEEEIFALPVIFGKSSGQEMIKEVYLPVLYHSKTPSFYDEIKIRLPAVLDENHHLFFTFSHISCQPKENAPVEIPIGYSVRRERTASGNETVFF